MVLCTLHIKPDRWAEEPVLDVVPTAVTGAGILPDEATWGEGPADSGPLLRGVRLSLRPSPSVLTIPPRAPWLLLASMPPPYIWGGELVESIVFDLLSMLAESSVSLLKKVPIVSG